MVSDALHRVLCKRATCKQPLRVHAPSVQPDLCGNHEGSLRNVSKSLYQQDRIDTGGQRSAPLPHFSAIQSAYAHACNDSEDTVNAEARLSTCCCITSCHLCHSRSTAETSAQVKLNNGPVKLVRVCMQPNHFFVVVLPGRVDLDTLSHLQPWGWKRSTLAQYQPMR